MKCWMCKEDAQKQCSVCGAHYCSQKCQKEDWKSHKIICHKYLYQRLKASTENSQASPDLKFEFSTQAILSFCKITSTNNGKETLRIYGNYQRYRPFTKGKLFNDYCAICENEVNYIWLTGRCKIIMELENFDLEYVRCKKCSDKGRLLMPNFLPHDSELLSVTIFLCLREKRILKDLIKCIIDFTFDANKGIAVSCLSRKGLLLAAGDMIANRYAQKGICASILPDIDLAYTEN